jgi:hypothetical protein
MTSTGGIESVPVGTRARLVGSGLNFSFLKDSYGILLMNLASFALPVFVFRVRTTRSSFCVTLASRLPKNRAVASFHRTCCHKSRARFDGIIALLEPRSLGKSRKEPIFMWGSSFGRHSKIHAIHFPTEHESFMRRISYPRDTASPFRSMCAKSAVHSRLAGASDLRGFRMNKLLPPETS